MIGIFDSGIGGLGFAKEVNQVLPQCDFVYLGDQLRVPYGNRSKEAIQQFTEECVQKLWELGANLVIIACNTASSESLRFLQQKYPQKKILGVLIPGVEKALKTKGNIGIIATKGTVKSQSYVNEIKKRAPNKEVFQVAAPLLVPLIEENMGKKTFCRKIIKTYVRRLKDAKVKILVLGCTHYGHIYKVFKSIMGSQVQIIDPSKEAAYKLVDYLKRHPEIDQQITKNGQRKFYTTDCPDFFHEQAKNFYGQAIIVEKIVV